MPGFPFVPRGFVIIFSQSRYSARLANNTEFKKKKKKIMSG